MLSENNFWNKKFHISNIFEILKYLIFFFLFFLRKKIARNRRELCPKIEKPFELWQPF